MKHLVIAVSPDSSLELLNRFADIIVLDKDDIINTNTAYDSVYIRSHFGQQSTLPRNFRTEIDQLVQNAKDANPELKYIDGIDTVDAIVAFEDKWLQYTTFGAYMPRTELYDKNAQPSTFLRPVYKNRLSSRGTGVTWNEKNIGDAQNNWIVQESIDIQEELRIYIICGKVYPAAAIKQSMAESNKAQGIDSRALSIDETTFSQKIYEMSPSLDIIGIDIARTTDGALMLMEVNRSPGFAKFYELTGTNLAANLYETLDRNIHHV